MRDFCLTRMHLLRAREYEFLVDLDRWHGALTEKQHAWLVAIYQRLGGTPELRRFAAKCARRRIFRR